MKILYASNNYIGSYLIQQRFIKNSKFNIKTSAYKQNLNRFKADWNLECLLNFSKSDDNISFNNFNYYFYYEEIKKFNPDLIISDLDIYTSTIALELGIKLWQVSPLLIFFGQNKNIKEELEVYNKHNYLINKNLNKKKYLHNIISNSDKNFIYSFLGDSNVSLNFNFEFVRPDFFLEEENTISQESKGTTLLLSDLFYNELEFDNFKNYDLEATINKSAIQKYNPKLILNNNIHFLSEQIEKINNKN